MRDEDWMKLLPRLIELAWEEGYGAGRREEKENHDE